MESYIRFILRNRALVLFVCLVVTALALHRISFATFGSSLGKMFLGENPEYAAYLERSAEFGTDEVMLVGLEGVDPTNSESLAKLDAATMAIEEMEEVQRVYSLANAQQVFASGDSLRVRSFGGQVDQEPERAREILREFREDPITSVLVSESGKDVAVVVELYPDPERQAEDGPIFIGKVEAAFKEAGFKAEQIRKAGIIAVMAVIIGESIRSVAVILPFVSLTLFLIVFLMFRRLWPAVVGLGVAGVAMIWSMGFAVWLEPQISVAIAIAPSVILIVAMSDVIHLCSAYLLELKSGKDKDTAIQDSGTDVGIACFYTSLTTFVGFASISFVPTPVFRILGVVLGFGVGTALLLAMTITPIILSFMRTPTLYDEGTTHRIQNLITRGMNFIARLATERAWWVIGCFAMLGALMIVGLYHLHIETRLMQRLTPDHPLRQDARFIEKNFSTTHMLDIYLTSSEEKGLLAPKTFKKVQEFQTRIKERDDVLDVHSYVDLIQRIHGTLNGPEASAELLEKPGTLAQYILLFEMSGGKDLDRLLDFDRKKARIAIRLKDEGFLTAHESGNQVSALGAEIMPEDIDVRPSGVLHLLGGWISEIIRGQSRGLLFTLIMTSFMMCIGLRSLKVGLWSMIPNVFPLLVLGGVLGFVLDDVDSDTLVFAMLAIGIGVDDTIHFLMRYRIEAARCSDRREALKQTFDFAGRSIVMTTATLAIGFLPFAISDYQITRMFGTLLPMTFVVALVADLFLVPAFAEVGLLAMDNRKRESEPSG